MENIDDFLGKPKDIEWNGKTYSITPMTISALDALAKARSEDPVVQQEGAKEVAFEIMKKFVPEITKEQFEMIDANTMDELTIKFWDTFDEEVSPAKAKLIAKMKEQQDAAKHK